MFFAVRAFRADGGFTFSGNALDTLAMPLLYC